MFGIGGSLHQIQLTLYTDAFVIAGSIQTRQRRVTDILNQADDPFLVLSDVTFDEFGPTGATVKAEFAQVNLASVLFAVAHDIVEAVPELRTPKMPEPALISIPPFKVTGRIHVLPERSLRDALSELQGTFIPVTQATYWSDTLGEARATAELVAVNHGLAQVLAPHREVDPWAGLPSDHVADAAASPAEPGPEAPSKETLGW
jgi:hypothetical protein